MNDNSRLLFDAVYEDLRENCDCLGGRVDIAGALIMKDDFLSALNDTSKEILLKNFVACLHIANSSHATMEIRIDTESNIARACFWAQDFDFSAKEMISFGVLLLYAQFISISSENGVPKLTVDLPISIGE